MQEKILKLKKKLKEQKVKGLALDIDETLSRSNIHWFEHMFQFHRPEGYTKKEVLRKFRFVEEVSEWRTGEAFAYMKKIRNSNEFNETIPLIEDSNHVVRKINEIVPIAVYITARPVTVTAGTLKWLKKHGFPEAELILRPKDAVEAPTTDLTARNRWKASVLNILYPEVIGIVDDNPGLAHELDKLGYKGTLFLYGKESGEFKNHKQVIVCPTWKSVTKAVISSHFLS